MAPSTSIVRYAIMTTQFHVKGQNLHHMISYKKLILKRESPVAMSVVPQHIR